MIKNRVYPHNRDADRRFRQPEGTSPRRSEKRPQEEAMPKRLLLMFLATGSFLSAAASSANAQGVKSMNYIDAHVHVWTPDTWRYPLASGFNKENMKPASFNALCDCPQLPLYQTKEEETRIAFGSNVFFNHRHCFRSKIAGRRCHERRVM